MDGQQRITSLCLLLGQKPYWWADAEEWNDALKRYEVMVNLLPDDGDDRMEFALPNPVRRQDPRWVSVQRVLGLEREEDLTSLAQKIMKAVGSDPVQRRKLFSKVHARLFQLWQPLHGKPERFGKPVPGSIPTIVRSFKSATTRHINALRGTPGAPVWQRNYYEHIIRTEESLNRIREYILTNPIRWAMDWKNLHREGVDSFNEWMNSFARREDHAR